MKLTLKNVKIHHDMSDETLCFSATVYADGKRAGVASNRGCGGPNFYDWHIDPKLGAEIEAWAQSQTIMLKASWDEDLPEWELTFDKLDHFIDQLLDEWQEEKWLKSKCRTKTLIKLGDTAENAWLIYNEKFSQDLKTWLENRHGDNLVEIANERWSS